MEQQGLHGEKKDVVKFVPSEDNPKKGTLSWWCPICETLHAVPVVSNPFNPNRNVWGWNGNVTSPVLDHCVHNSCGEGTRSFLITVNAYPLIAVRTYQEALRDPWGELEGNLISGPILRVDKEGYPLYIGPHFIAEDWPLEIREVLSVKSIDLQRSQLIRRVLERP